MTLPTFSQLCVKNRWKFKLKSHVLCGQDFGNDSVLSDDLDEEPELILDAEPRYASPLTTVDLLPGLEREMAVDEDVEEQEMDTMKDQESSKVKDATLPSYLSEKTRSWEKPMTSNLYQFNTQADSQEQVIHYETRFYRLKRQTKKNFFCLHFCFHNCNTVNLYIKNKNNHLFQH